MRRETALVPLLLPPLRCFGCRAAAPKLAARRALLFLFADYSNFSRVFDVYRAAQ